MIRFRRLLSEPGNTTEMYFLSAVFIQKQSLALLRNSIPLPADVENLLCVRGFCERRAVMKPRALDCLADMRLRYLCEDNRPSVQAHRPRRLQIKNETHVSTVRV